MQAIDLSAEEAITVFSPLAETIWLIALADGSVKIIKDKMVTADEGKILDYETVRAYYKEGYVYTPDMKQWDDELSLQALRALAAAGEREKQLDMRFRHTDIGFEWHDIFVRVLVDANGKPDRVLLLGRQATDSQRAHIIETAVSTEYDYVNYIEADNNSYVRYIANAATGTPLPPLASDDYENEVAEYNRQYVVPEEAEEVTRKLSLAYVGPILERDGECVLYCTCLENGEKRHKKLRFSYYDRARNIWLLTRTDVTEVGVEKRQKELLKDALEAATLANRAKSEFLSRMSHDIRTPMNAIIGMTAIAEAHLHQPERVEDCLGKITTASKLLLGLINEVLDMSKIESGSIVLSEEELSLPDLVQGVVAMVQPAIKSKRQRFEVHLNGVHNENVISDMQRLQQLILNLLTNAVKYTPDEGRILLEISEKPSGIAKVGCYEFVVADNGVGVSEAFIPKLFEPFERAEDASIRAIQGTGLGLAITKNIVEMMNGDIQVESVYGGGTTFTVSVYLKLADTEAVDASALLHLPVLVVDDDEIVCRNTCQRLDELGMCGQFALNGPAAIAKTIAAHQAGQDFLAVIIDLVMPEMDGIETARRIRSLVGEDVPIIMISAYDWSEYEEEALRAGVNGFIMKPLFSSRLIQKLKQLVLKEPVEAKAPAALQVYHHDYGGRRILLVEDNELNREIAEELLTTMGVTVESAENGQVAVEKVAASPEGTYALIFMDMQMPVLDGCAAASQIRQLPRRDAQTLPIIAMTANAFAEDIVKTRRAGMNEHMAKPIDVATLSRVLERWLGSN